MSNRPERRFRVWIVSGPSGSGKTTLVGSLLREPVFKRTLVKSVSYTTRPKRAGEKEGKDYRHISTPKFLALLRRKGFLEHEKIFGSYYGTPKSVVRDAQKAGKDLILCIDVKGARTVRRFFKEKASSIFILPPGLEVLSARLKKRSTEDKKDIEKRLKRVRIELSYVKDYDYVVVNDDLNEALSQIKSIMTAKQCEGAYVRSVRKTYR